MIERLGQAMWFVLSMLLGLEQTGALMAWCEARRAARQARRDAEEKAWNDHFRSEMARIRADDAAEKQALSVAAPSRAAIALLAAEAPGAPTLPDGKPMTPDNARVYQRAQGMSELFGNGDAGHYGIQLNPVPLHPRAISGNEIRIMPDLPITSGPMLQVLLALSGPEYEKRQFSKHARPS